MTRAGSPGFTLIEVVISIAIATAAIVLGVALYRSIGTATQSGKTAARDWVTEQFMRTQIGNLDGGMIERTKIVRQETHEFGFISRRSARWGTDGPPVLVVWRFDSDSAALLYHENPLPAWWPEDRPVDVDYDRLSRSDEGDAWSGRIFSDLDDVKFNYWDERSRTWQSDMSIPDHVARIVRLEVIRGTDRRGYAFEARGGSSFFSSSGSSPAAH